MNRSHGSASCCSLSSAVFLSATASWSQVPENTYQDLHWRMIGPFRGGRTRAAAGVPSQPNVFYIGQVNGGVWKSDDYGRTWNPIFDHESTQSIGAIAVSPSDPNIIYVAQRRRLASPRSLGRQWHLQIDRRRQDLDSSRAFAMASRFLRSPLIRAIPTDFCRGARPSLRAERRARNFSLDRWRPELAESDFERRKHRRLRCRDRSRQIPMSSMPRCGKRAKARGKTATNSTAAAADSSNPPMAAAPGIN